MKKIIPLTMLIILNMTAFAQKASVISLQTKLPASKVDFDAYENLVKEVKEYRKQRIVALNEFLSMSAEKNTVILDTRSTEMYQRKHLKGAIHLNFSDFTQDNLQRLIPLPNTRILIYCNNNFDNDPIVFATKSYTPRLGFSSRKSITLALNIPTFINLYGYGYRNVYELGDLVPGFYSNLFEGTDVPKLIVPQQKTLAGK